MNLSHRLKRIERAVAPKGGCAECHGAGPLPPHFTLFEDEPLPPMPACPGCGRAFCGPFRAVRLPREVGSSAG